jgi:hypothetical protein
MRKTLVSLALAVLVAGGGAVALAQSLPTSQPKFVHIFREEVKIGRSAEHSRWEAGFPAAFEKAKSPDTYIALESVTGPAEVWYVIPYASQAAFGESAAKQDADPVLTAELERLSRGDAEFVTEVNAIEAVARPDLSHGAFPDLSKMRFWEITTFRVKPGHAEDFAAAAKAWASASARSAPSASWRTYEVVAGAPGGTYLVFGSVASFAEFDKGMAESDATFKGLTFEERTALQKYETEAALNTVTNRFRLDPRQSYVPADVRQKDPAFWMPKAPARTAAPPKKKP